MQWDINTGQRIASFEGHTQDVMAISLVSLVVEFLELEMARGIPRPSILEVPDLFSLLDSPRNRFYHSSDPRVLAKIR